MGSVDLDISKPDRAPAAVEVGLDMGKLDQALAKVPEGGPDMGRPNQGSRISDWVKKDIDIAGRGEGSYIADREEGSCIADQAGDSRTVSMCILTDPPLDTIRLEHNRQMRHLKSQFFDVSPQFFHIYQF